MTRHNVNLKLITAICIEKILLVHLVIIFLILLKIMVIVDFSLPIKVEKFRNF
jgi:hypothetical protein